MKNAAIILWALIKGSLITARHFFTNLWFHFLRLIGIKKYRPGAVTIQYPEQTKPLPSRYRAAHRLTKRPDGKPRCVACLLCATVCPSECIIVEATEDPDPEVQKHASRFEIDLARCCFCGFCVEACPEDAIRMDTGRIDLAARSRADLVWDIDQLSRGRS
ncbi:MAG: NADH-quinone oxidoreductase subunit I [Candidatus Aminicenantes bacterium]|nr:NADH-quinone oxidoreductase subunit I [Candidatus Aminicenantes bacterium]